MNIFLLDATAAEGHVDTPYHYAIVVANKPEEAISLTKGDFEAKALRNGSSVAWVNPKVILIGKAENPKPRVIIGLGISSFFNAEN